MKSSYKHYHLQQSIDRIDDILLTGDPAYEEVKSIPSRDRLTFNNGFYVWCSVLFIDIRGSSDLPSKYRRPSLARIYRAYISEMVAIINGNINCAELNIEGDAVWGVFDTPYKDDINSVFSTAAQLASMTKILNCRFQKKKGYSPINTGIGMDYGRALMLKAGYKGSSINDIVWMGDVVNNASKLCSSGNKCSYDKQIMVSNCFYNYLNDHNKNLLYKNYNRDCYHGDVVNNPMENWWKQNCNTLY